MAGEPVKSTVLMLPSAEVALTVKASVATDTPSSRSSSKLNTSTSPSTAADNSEGAVVSGVLLVTSWPPKLATWLPAMSARRLSLLVGWVYVITTLMS